MHNRTPPDKRPRGEGRYAYFLTNNEPSQTVDFFLEDGRLFARFLDVEEEDGQVVLPCEEMVGRFERTS